MEHLIPRTVEGAIVSTVLLAAVVWQLQSGLMMFGVSINTALFIWVLLFAVLLYAAFAFVSMGSIDAEPA